MVTLAAHRAGSVQTDDQDHLVARDERLKRVLIQAAVYEDLFGRLRAHADSRAAQLANARNSHS
jgi:hypothetical protein